MINIILTDDHQIIRDGLKALLKEEETIHVIGEASDGDELMRMLPALTPDVVLMDMNMPMKDGFETTKLIRENYPDIKVLVLTMLNHESYINRVMDMGAFGYVLKSAGREELCTAIKLVASGTPYICAEVALELLKKVQNPLTYLSDAGATRADKGMKDLSKREVEVLGLISEGFTNAEIADKLFTSKRTIETHRQNLLEKTQTKNTATLIKFAMLRGIIS